MESSHEHPALTIRDAHSSDIARIHELLRGESLPIEGVDQMLMTTTSIAAHHGDVVGTASIEVLGSVGLLRSVVVAETWRGRGLGRRLVVDRITWARESLDALFLFADTDPTFFEKLGFVPVKRDELPADLEHSAEFGLCRVCPPLRHDLDR